MILEAFGSGNDIITRVPFQPTMIAFVEGIINALQHQGVKEDMEHYATRWAAQSINAAADNLQKKGEQYALLPTCDRARVYVLYRCLLPHMYC